MHKTIFAILTLSVGSSAYSQDIPKKYADLLQKVQQINCDQSLQKITLKNEEVTDHTTDGGLELTGYFKNGKLLKITRTIGMSYGMETFDYYFDEEKLVFIYEMFKRFVADGTGALNYEKTETNFIGRYYFRDNKLIDNETIGHNRFEDDEVDMEGSLLTETKDSMSRLKKAKRKKTSRK